MRSRGRLWSANGVKKRERSECDLRVRLGRKMRDVVKCEGAVQVRCNERQERMQDAQDLEEGVRGRRRAGESMG